MAKSPAQEPPPGPTHSNHPSPCSALSPGRISHLLALRGVMLKGGPGRPRAFGNRSTHICSFPWGGRHNPALSPPFSFNQHLPTACSALDTWSTGQRSLRPAWRGSASSRGDAFSGTIGLSPLPQWPGTWGVPGGQGSGSGQLPGDGDVCWVSPCQVGRSRGHSNLGVVDVVVEGQRVWFGHRGSEGFQTRNHSTCHPSARALFASSCYLWPHLTGGGERTDLTSVHVSMRELTFQHLQCHSGELEPCPQGKEDSAPKSRGDVLCHAQRHVRGCIAPSLLVSPSLLVFLQVPALSSLPPGSLPVSAQVCCPSAPSPSAWEDSPDLPGGCSASLS